MVVGLSALTVRVVAVGVSFWEVSILEHQSRANVWPHLSFSLEVGTNSDGHFLGTRLSVENDGAGPLRIRWMTVEWDGEPVRSWLELFEKTWASDLESGSPKALMDIACNAHLGYSRFLRPGKEEVLVGARGRLGLRLAHVFGLGTAFASPPATAQCSTSAGG